MVTVEQYLGQHAAGHEDEITEELRANAAVTVERANQLCGLAGIPAALRSGWRPAGYNAGVPGAAKRSTHITGEAIDLADDDGALHKWIAGHLDALELLGLWTEDGRTTPSWCHVQTRPPASGNRVYIPSADWAARLSKEGSKNV